MAVFTLFDCFPSFIDQFAWQFLGWSFSKICMCTTSMLQLLWRGIFEGMHVNPKISQKVAEQLNTIQFWHFELFELPFALFCKISLPQAQKGLEQQLYPL